MSQNLVIQNEPKVDYVMLKAIRELINQKILLSEKANAKTEGFGREENKLVK